MFYCQPVLGIGHFIRSREIVYELHDFDVTFVSGGEIPRGFELPAGVGLLELPPMHSDAEFRAVHSSDASLDLEEVKQERRRLLLEEYERVRPDVLILELFPFGRRKFQFELLPLLERAKQGGANTLVVCSLRDILVGKRKQAQFDDDAVRLMNQYFDLLLIHSDPKFQRLDETFTRLTELTCDVRYTGFVVQRGHGEVDHEVSPFDEREPVIVVSVGGGRVGHELIDCAVDAQPLIARFFPHRMRVLAGPQMGEDEYQALARRAAENAHVTLERHTTEFPAYLRHAALSISLAGYNTCMDILAAGVRAVVYPFAGNNNQEQTVRAAKLAAAGRVRVIHAGELTPGRLAEEARMALETPAEALETTLDTRGAEQTAAILADLLRGRGEI
jgi:predicted glycosyltransferase